VKRDPWLTLLDVVFGVVFVMTCLLAAWIVLRDIEALVG